MGTDYRNVWYQDYPLCVACIHDCKHLLPYILHVYRFAAKVIITQEFSSVNLILSVGIDG